FLECMLATYPERGLLRQPAAAYPVHTTGAVGVAGWTLPDVSIVDLCGLCDRVVARGPVTAPMQLPRTQLHSMFAVADRHRDGLRSPDELRAARARPAGAGPIDPPGWFGDALLALGRGERPSLDCQQFEAIAATLAGRPCIAHERRAP